MSSQLQNQSFDQLNETYARNLKAFAKFNPQLHEKVVSHTPSIFKLTVDQKGFINIENKSGKLFYNDDPQMTTASQLHKFNQSPIIFKSELQANNTFDPRACTTLNQLHMGMLLEQHYNFIESEKSNATDYIPFLLVVGIGLGYHLEYLAKKTRIMAIFEPQFDVFFLSMFTTRYDLLIRHFSQDFHQLLFFIDKTPMEMLGTLDHQFKNRNYLLSNTHIFSHYTNSALSDEIKTLVDHWHYIHFTSGFIEDELYGLNHLLASTKVDTPLLLNHYHHEPPIKTPVFIIASGPSVTENLSLVKSIRDKIIVISCSSSIAICHKHEIQPDFHVETERRLEMLHYFSQFPDKNYLKGITLLNLGPVHPGISAFFKNHITALKDNDLGSRVLNEMLENPLAQLKHCLPTSGNGAINFAQAMGFQFIYAIGLDFGFTNETEHHAKDSVYYQENDIWDVKSVHHDKQIPAVNGGTIGTSLLLDSARQVAEHLAQHLQQHQFINLSSGALIRGFKHQKLADIFEKLNSLEPASHEAVQHTIFNNTTTLRKQGLSPQDFLECTNRRRDQLIRKMRNIVLRVNRLCQIPQSTKALVFDWLDLVNHEFYDLSKGDDTLHGFLKGTFKTLEIITAITLMQIREGNILSQRMSVILRIWNEHLQDLVTLFSRYGDQTCDNMPLNELKDKAFKLYESYHVQEDKS